MQGNHNICNVSNLVMSKSFTHVLKWPVYFFYNWTVYNCIYQFAICLKKNTNCLDLNKNYLEN